jgi:2-keto-3-deoxy-L-rhamnonate aldolase RhmA
MSGFGNLVTSKKCLLGAYITFDMQLSAHLLGRCGFDWALIDMEHSTLSVASATAIVHALAVGSNGKCLPVIRVPSNGVEYLKWALDSGAAGVVIPMVNDKIEMELIIQRARYPPLGQRSFGPFNAPWADLSADSDIPKYFTKTAPNLAVIPMIESVQGVENAEEIISVTGVSGVFVGPVDLRLSMGLNGPHGEEKEYTVALEKILEIGRSLEIPVGIFAASEAVMERMAKMGFLFFLVTGDNAALVSGANSALEKSRVAMQKAKI